VDRVYLTAAAERLAATTLQVHLAAIVTAHRLVGLSLDPGHSSIALLMDGIRRRKGTRPARQATPISAAMLARMVRAHHGCFERTGPLSTVLTAPIHASCAEPNRWFPHHSGVPHGRFQVVGLKEISQLVGAIAVEDHDHVIRIIDRLQNAFLEGVLLPTLVGIVDRLPGREVLNPVLYDCRCHGGYLPAALPAGQAWSDLSIIRLILETSNFSWLKPAVLNAAESRLHREAALEVRRIDSGS
jgi:hypothetical protein